MTEKYISPQVRILKSCLDRGGSATTIDIIKDHPNMTLSGVTRNGYHLVNRSLVTKKVPMKKEGGYGPATFTIRYQRLKKINELISRAYGEDIENVD